MSLIETEEISLDEIYQLAFNVFSDHGCDTDNATALARTVTNAERDGSLSHGLFRMPGKVNPVIPEAVNQTAFQVIGNDLVISLAAEGGQLQLNAFEPVLAVNILRSLRYMTNAIVLLRTKCVEGITANVEVCAHYVETSPGIATFFTPQLGYKESARIAKRALKEGITVREIVIQEGLMSEDQVNAVLHVDNLTKPNIR